VREKGVSSIVVIAVVVIIIAAVGASGYFLLKGGGAGLGSLSVYTGSQSWAIPSAYQENLPAGVEAAGYTVSGTSVQAVLDWYRGQMTGWTLKSEPVLSMGEVEIGGLIYMKGDDGAGIIAMSGLGLPGTCYILVTGPWSAFGELEGQVAPPSAMLTVSAHASGNNVVLTISHEGGDDLNISDLVIMGSDSTGTMQTATLSPSSGTLSVGETLTAIYTYGGTITTSRAITVYIIHEPSKQKLFSSASVIVEAESTSTPSAMLAVTAESTPDPTLVKITISHEGGDSFIFHDLEVRASDSTGYMMLVPTTISGGATVFSVGGTEYGYYTYGANPIGKAITVYVIYKPTGYKIFNSSTVIVEPEAGIFDGTYNCNVTTVTPIGTTSLPGTFTVNNGFVYDPGYTFEGIVDANGHFTGTTIVSQGGSPMWMTGTFSLTENFTIYGSSGNVSQTIVAHENGGAQTWTITCSGNVATLTVGSSGKFTGSGWVGSTPGGSYNIPITDGSMYGTTMTFTANATYDNGQGTIQGTCFGTMNASFPNATSATGTWAYTISDPLGTRSGSQSWTAIRIGGGGGGAPPSAMLTVAAKENSGGGYDITIMHEGGDDLVASDLEIQASNSATTMQTGLTFTTSTGTFKVGDSVKIHCTYSGSSAGKAVTVYIIHTPSQQKLFSSSGVVVTAGSTSTPSAMVTVSAHASGNNVVLTISHEGGDDLSLADLAVTAIRDTTSAENTNIGAGTLDVGYSIQVLENLSVNPYDAITVYVTYVPTQQKLFASAGVIVQAGLPPTPPPTQLLTVRAENINSTTIKLTISHESGDDLSLADLQVQGSDSTGTMQTATLSPSSGTLPVGSTFTATYTYGASPSGAVITVYVTYVPTGQKIFSSSSIVVHSSTMSRTSAPSAMLIVTAKGTGNNVTLTISHEGGDDLPIADLQVMASYNTGTVVTVASSPSSGTLSVGGTLTATYSYGASATGKAITVYIIHEPSKQKLFSSSSIIVQ
jgi:hypothetical protein